MQHTKFELEDRAEADGEKDAVGGATKYTSLPKKSPFNYAYEKGYAAGLAKRNSNAKSANQ